MKNSIVLVREDDTESLRHGGPQQYRNFSLFINEVLIRRYRDDDPFSGYDSGPELNRRISREVELLEKALGCKMLKCERKGRTKLIKEARGGVRR